MNVCVSPGLLTGTVPAISSKSDAHRILIAASLSDAPTKVFCNVRSEDILATVSCMRALGAQIDDANGVFTVKPCGGMLPKTPCVWIAAKAALCCAFCCPWFLRSAKAACSQGAAGCPNAPLRICGRSWRHTACAFQSPARSPYAPKGRLRRGNSL